MFKALPLPPFSSPATFFLLPSRMWKPGCGQSTTRLKTNIHKERNETTRDKYKRETKPRARRGCGHMCPLHLHPSISIPPSPPPTPHTPREKPHPSIQCRPWTLASGSGANHLQSPVAVDASEEETFPLSSSPPSPSPSITSRVGNARKIIVHLLFIHSRSWTGKNCWIVAGRRDLAPTDPRVLLTILLLPNSCNLQINHFLHSISIATFPLELFAVADAEMRSGRFLAQC